MNSDVIIARLVHELSSGRKPRLAREQSKNVAEDHQSEQDPHPNRLARLSGIVKADRGHSDQEKGQQANLEFGIAQSTISFRLSPISHAENRQDAYQHDQHNRVS